MDEMKKNTNSLIKYKQNIKKAFFINGNKSFNQNTPEYLLNDLDCQKISIKQNINSINFLKKIDDSIVNFVIEEALRQNYILSKDSPIILKRDLNVIINSISNNVFSCNCVDWEYFESHFKSKIVEVTKKIIDGGYVLSDSTPNGYLKDNLDIVSSSIRKDINTFSYANIYLARENYDIFRFLVLNDYNFSSAFLLKIKLSFLREYDVFLKVFKQINLFDNYNEEFINNYCRFYYDIINSKPLIKNFNEILSFAATKKWEKYHHIHINFYANISMKICSTLQSMNDWNDLKGQLPVLEWMKEVLKNDHEILLSNMYDYYNVFHSNVENKSLKLVKPKEAIARLSSLYVSKSKENYKKKIIKKGYFYLTEFYHLRKDNSFLRQRIIFKRKNQAFYELYSQDNPTIMNYINNLVSRYRKYLSDDEIIELINVYVVYGISKLSDIYRPPEGFYEYERLEKARKIFHRLQNGYITYDSNEAMNYHDLITYENGYFFNEKNISSDTKEFFQKYKLKLRIFKELKYEIVKMINTINVNEEISDRDVFAINFNLPFNDEYYEFDDNIFDAIDLKQFIDDCMSEENINPESFLNKDNIKKLYDIFINKNMMWLNMLLIHRDYEMFYDLEETKIEYQTNIINQIGKIYTLAKISKSNIDKLDSFFRFVEISDKASLEDIAVLGIESIIKLCQHDDYTRDDYDTIISMSRELLLQMMRRDSSTVPYINGEYLNYKYSMYDSQEESVLYTGIDTDACFKINGNDHDFMHYCTIDKNGFIIKICNQDNNFIARAAGFRNGNCIFINQLRTIYDACGNNYEGINKKEKNDIIKVFEKACEDIIETSHNNLNEKDKIDFVFVTRSYILSNYNSKKIVPDEIDDIIGSDPMDNESSDWKKFIDTTYNLEECENIDSFETDYGCYPIILIANSKILKPEDISFKDVLAVYKRKRNKVMTCFNIDLDTAKKINKIKSCYCFYNNIAFKQVIIPRDAITIYGDNWYIIYLNGQVIDSIVLSFDSEAQKEYQATVRKLLSINEKKDVKKLIKKNV